MMIEKKHFEYLVIQRGEVSDARHNFDKWQVAYEQSLKDIYESLRDVLPDRVENCLDIGSGLGGIDVLLGAHYGRCFVPSLVDGREDLAQVVSSTKTFSNYEVALDFLAKNGVGNALYFDPGEFKRAPPKIKYDLVVSFAAYAFHIPPAEYLEEIKAVTTPKTVLVFDVRKAKRDWLEDLIRAFGQPKVLLQRTKFVRLAFHAR